MPYLSVFGSNGKESRQEESVDLVFISDGEILDQHLDFYRRSNLMPCDYLISEEIGQAYGIGKVPYAVLIGAPVRSLPLEL